MKRALLAVAIAACHRPEVDRDGGFASKPSTGLDAAVAPESSAPVPPVAVSVLAEHYVGRALMDGLELPNGERVSYDDGRTKTMAQRIAAPDIEDVFAMEYPRGAIVPVTDPEEDPGRVRIEALFRATYGADAKAVSASLVSVKFAGHTVSFHRRAAPALERVARRLEPLLATGTATATATYARFFKDLGGTFNPRTIAGTTQASAHSWGIAIDIDTTLADYWRNGPLPPVWRSRIPQAIVDAFEAEGFVWGGRWFHYDTMHFEYRPELFDPRVARAVGTDAGR